MESLLLYIPIIVGILATMFFFGVIVPMMFRTVVSTNDVHIVQSKRKTVSYGKDQPSGNVYYSWPAWMPFIGIKTTTLPVSVFDLRLNDYAAYDKGRVPFVIDIMAFFRIEDSNIAAQRVHSQKELVDQLTGIVQGACRSILAKSEIEEILEERARYGVMFTESTNEQLQAWGVVNVKNIELMDIRDQQGSKVIQNIMSKKQSQIERESRVVVASNNQAAQTAEIEAKQAVMVRQQEADEFVGIRTAQKIQQIGIAEQKANQEIKGQEKATAEKEMAVKQVNFVKQAEIEKEVSIVHAEQDKTTIIIKAEGTKQSLITQAEGAMETARLQAEGIKFQGDAKGAAETAILMAPVNAQTALAKEIGANAPYQNYLVTIKQLEVSQAVGIEQAKALTHAEVKVFSNSGNPSEGIKGVMDLFSSKGGLQIGGMVEAMKATGALDNLPKRSANGSMPASEGH